MPSSTLTTERELLASVPGELADLHRSTSDCTIQVIYLPDLSEPTEAHLAIFDGNGDLIDQLTVIASLGTDSFRHPTRYSVKLAEYLTARDHPAAV